MARRGLFCILLMIILGCVQVYEARDFEPQCVRVPETYVCVVPDRTKFGWEQARWDQGIGAYAYQSNGANYIWTTGFLNTKGRLVVDNEKFLGHELSEALAMTYPETWAIPHRDQWGTTYAEAQ